jgi:hypothetical protein
MWVNPAVNYHDFDDITVEKNGFPRSGVEYNPGEEFTKNTSKFGNIIPIKGHSPYGIKYLGDPIDLFFLDSLHSNPSDWNNLCYFVPYLKPGAILCGHDYIPSEFPDVIENISRLENIIGKKVVKYNESSIWMFKLDAQISSKEMKEYRQ